MNQSTMDLLITIGIIVFGIYELYKGVSQYINHIKAKKECLSTHKNNYEAYKEYTLWASGYALGTVVAAITAVYRLVVEADYMYAAGFGMLAACGIGFMLDAIVKRSALFYEDAFFYEATLHRYRNVAKVAPRNGLFPSYNVTLSKGPAMIVTRKMGELLQTKIKDNKKNKKKKGDHEQ